MSKAEIKMSTHLTLCPVCRRRRMPDASKTRKSRCHTCDKRIERANNPMRAAFNRLRDKARERRIPFTLSFDYFREFAEKCDCLHDAHINRPNRALDGRLLTLYKHHRD